MPTFPERESSLLAKLKKGKPRTDEREDNGEVMEKKQRPTAIINNVSSFNPLIFRLFKGSLVDVDGGNSVNKSDPLAEVFAAPASTIDFSGGDDNLAIENEKDIFKWVFE